MPTENTRERFEPEHGQWGSMHVVLVVGFQCECREILLNRRQIIDFTVWIQRAVRISVDEVAHPQVLTQAHSFGSGNMAADHPSGFRPAEKENHETQSPH